MKSKLIAILFVLSPGMGLAADIASVNFDAIKDDLREIYLAKPENTKLRENYKTARESEKSFHAQIEEKLKAGDKPIDFRSLMPKGGTLDRFQMEREIDSALKKELYLIVSGLGLKYELIYDSSDSGAVIYAKSQVDDVTTLVKQAIIDQGKKK
jgi:hypothetical protein